MSFYKGNHIGSRCKEILKEVGIQKDQVILDFGCGKGNYTIPAAKLIGKEGKVYALDENRFKLEELSRRIKSEELNNIKIINTFGNISIDLQDDSVDVVLLYDVFWFFPLRNSNLSKLLNEVYRVSKKNALILVYPAHIETEKLKQKIEEAGFHLQNRFSGNIIHEDMCEKGQILNFKK